MKRGGKNAEKLTNNIMAKLVTDDLATNFSLKGKQKKKTFMDLRIFSCIIGKYLFLYNSFKSLFIIKFLMYGNFCLN